MKPRRARAKSPCSPGQGGQCSRLAGHAQVPAGDSGCRQECAHDVLSPLKGGEWRHRARAQAHGGAEVSVDPPDILGRDETG